MTLPSEIEAGGKLYRIKTGHPYWFRFAEILGGGRAVFSDADYLYTDDKPADRKAGFSALMSFFQPKMELPRPSGGASSEKAVDFTLDAPLIYAGILEQYGVDLFEREIHWHKVLAMISGLHSTRLNEIISYRLYSPPSKSDTQESIMRRLQRAWRIESADEKEEAMKAAENERAFFAKIRR